MVVLSITYAPVTACASDDGPPEVDPLTASISENDDKAPELTRLYVFALKILRTFGGLCSGLEKLR